LIKSHDGTGLGLSIVKRLAELHDATFTLRSDPNRGTTAEVRFPRDRVVETRDTAADQGKPSRIPAASA
jgi:signal transduction histidine kinase